MGADCKDVKFKVCCCVMLMLGAYYCPAVTDIRTFVDRDHRLIVDSCLLRLFLRFAK